MEERDSETGWRGSREGWLQAAYEALIEGGVESVKIMTLAARLKLSRTSFYWFFKDRADVLDALRSQWAGTTTAPLVAASAEYAESRAEAMLNVLACFLSGRFDARFEFAARSWGLQDPAMAAAVEAADAERLAALTDMLARWGHDPQEADVRARTVYLVQIGYISMRAEETLETRLARIPNYVEIYTGVRPEPREMARFRARLGLAV
ncbi:TetR family transcriptional regulator [Rhodobacter sphaeroides]|jgi:AcrR family transcriptional regulator|uniref:Transcriptional regulator, TetR family n=1 Tax=Cereibacter sphaeroides (strain ATCC 17023 / DSM 158 / JCM 6121 / CCUG 31486 / LMG 2827 / NBRC 12203 / NCIMB 8253 / ATH 2.4.1.) TaxID=272943 RepID=Q3IVZ5_CERS4|nr:TetR/AcrR family transcriptional regulator [Cereibacter sphaeroides]ABN78508.1 transcriptional regulator, TetR family [Cereibacter sphaeroides ATCC 17029]ABA81289.1 transcriptional regulator, TetR family [Cereibacter sphaeroides 2.4.1]AMJ49585.1 TetR family transcriptional regulator [Cereibacter sphaeroides]ANS36298.1 TetR family transcriptional regulator [Cereibacter sphaeroides]ATN65355.1 TetR family transcriptional regulator [Cereibacter sphaeroides]